MDILKMNKLELLNKCEELGISKCKSKNKSQLVELIKSKQQTATNVVIAPTGKYTFIEVCAGGGGLSAGLIKSGFTPLLLNDNNGDCCKTLKKNHPDANVVLGSMDKIDYSKYVNNVDLLTGGVPCFIAGTRVLTYDGYKNIEDVVLEDKLLTHTGCFQDIINLQKKTYTGFVYDLDIECHPEIITCTEEHPFYVREKKIIWDDSMKESITTFGEPVWKKANELTSNDYFGMVINNKEIIPEFTFEKKVNQDEKEHVNIKLDKPEHWYMLGYFIGDGWIEGRDEDEDEDEDEEDVLERINRFVHNACCDKYEKIDCSKFMWFNILKKCGHGIFIPEWVQDAPKEFIREFIDGFMKTDISDNEISQITTASLNIAYGLQRLCLKLGHIFSINKSVHSKRYYIKGVSQKDRNAISFIENNYVWFSPLNITKRETYETPVYNFEVKTDNSYIVMNTVVHNCQSFSQAGLRKGLDDPRGDLMIKFIEILNLVKPKVFMIENVKGLLTHEHGDTIKLIIETMNENNLYDITYKCLDASKYNVPQKRERVFIVGFLKNLNCSFSFPQESDTKKLLKDVLCDVPDSNGAKYSDEKIKLFKMIPQGGCWINLPENIQREYLGNSYNSGGGKRGILYRLSMEKPSLTLLCTPSQKQTERCHPLEERPLTVKEYSRIQTFDDDYEFIGSMNSQYKQIGNAVPVELAKQMGNSIINALQTMRTE